MKIDYFGPSDCFAYANLNGKKASEDPEDYVLLGRTLDKKAKIFESMERGIGTLDAKSGSFGPVPEDFAVKANAELSNMRAVRVVDFGDAFWMNAFLHTSGFMKVIDAIPCQNQDTLRAMVLYYILTDQECHEANEWFAGSIVSMLYPKAKLGKQSINSFLEAIGGQKTRYIFAQSYYSFVNQRYGKSWKIVIDNGCQDESLHYPRLAPIIYGKRYVEALRMCVAFHKSTGLPVYFDRAILTDDNEDCVFRVSNVLDHLESHTVRRILDGSYTLEDNFDKSYEGHKIDYIAQIDPELWETREILTDEFPDIFEAENFYEDEKKNYYFITKCRVMIGEDRDIPAWFYTVVGSDLDPIFLENESSLSELAKTHDLFASKELFCFVSSKEYPCNKFISVLMAGTASEWITDFAGKYNRIFENDKDFIDREEGHFLLSYIAACALRMAKLEMKKNRFAFDKWLTALRNQKCMVYPNSVITLAPSEKANAAYQALGMECPEWLRADNGILQYTPPETKAMEGKM